MAQTSPASPPAPIESAPVAARPPVARIDVSGGGLRARRDGTYVDDTGRVWTEVPPGYDPGASSAASPPAQPPAPVEAAADAPASSAAAASEPSSIAGA